VERMDVERPRRTSPARGVALIATAVIIGLFILRNGFESPTAGSDAPSVVDRETTTTAAAGDAGGTPAGADGTDTTEAPASRPPAEVGVVVANTTTVAGAAGGMSETIGALGYVMSTPTDADPELETTQVQFAPDFEAEAQALAEAIGLPPTAATPLAEPPPVDPAGVRVVVLLGRDLAVAA
jgi:hypothetical protein